MSGHTYTHTHIHTHTTTTITLAAHAHRGLITPDSDEDSEDEDLIDGDDRQIIDSTGTVNRHPQNTLTCINPRRDLTETI